MKKVLIPAFILASTISTSVLASDSTGWFADVSVGQSDVDVSGYDEDTSYKIGAGYMFNDNWSAGIEYVDLGEFDITVPGVTGSADVDGFNFYGRFSFPVNDSFNLFAKAGLFAWDGSASASGPGGSASLNGDGTDLSLGLGAEYKLNNSVSLKVEYERFDSDDDVDTITGGIAFRF